MLSEVSWLLFLLLLFLFLVDLFLFVDLLEFGGGVAQGTTGVISFHHPLFMVRAVLSESL